MRRCSWLSLSLVASLLMVVAVAQEKKDPPKEPAKPAKEAPAKPQEKAGGEKAPPKGEMPEMTPEMMAVINPGPAHKLLAKKVGEWTTATKMSGPGFPPEESAGTAKFSMHMDGRFLFEEYKGTMMGMPFTSEKILGYNNGSKKYEGVWMYTMGTGMMNIVGTSKDDGKTIDFDATFMNEQGVKEELKIQMHDIDDDHFVVKLFGGKMPDGSDGPVMESTYTRKK